METRTFTTAHILSVITGIGMVPEPDTYLGLVHYLLEYAPDDNRFTQGQLLFCIKQLRSQFPQFTEDGFKREVSVFEAKFKQVEDDRELREACALRWSNKWIMRYGTHFEVAKPTEAPPPAPEPQARNFVIQDGNATFIGRVIEY